MRGRIWTSWRSLDVSSYSCTGRGYRPAVETGCMMSGTVSGELAGVEGLLIDIDGVLTVGWSPIAGAAEALARLRSAGVPFRLVTNTTELSRRELVAALQRAGFDVRAEEVITAAVMTAEYLRANHPGAGCFVLGGAEGAEDLDGVRM